MKKLAIVVIIGVTYHGSSHRGSLCLNSMAVIGRSIYG
jgi:hypothetical protein